MKRVFEFTIDQPCNVQSYLNYLRVSHDLQSALKKPPCDIQVNGQHQNVLYPLQNGDCLSLVLVEEDETIEPEELPLTILYEDEDILVIDKPAGMPVHPSRYHQNDSLANGLAHYYKMHQQSLVFHCINRLDSDTSGLVLIAKNRFAASLLNQTRPQKEYLALAEGKCLSSGTVHAPILKVEGSMKRQINPAGDDAITHYQLLGYNEKLNCSLISLTLEYGRTHQIRVHMASIAHPLLGDRLYNPNNQQTKRQALHCHKMCFVHPIRHQPMVFESPLPQDLKLF